MFFYRDLLLGNSNNRQGEVEVVAVGSEEAGTCLEGAEDKIVVLALTIDGSSNNLV